MELPVPASEDCLERIVVGYPLSPLSLSEPLTGRLIDLKMMKHFNKSLSSALTADSYYYQIGPDSNLFRFKDFLPLPDLLRRLPLLRMESKHHIIS